MQGTKSADAKAAAVSRTLRAAGMRPLPSGTARGREGIRVSRGTHGTSVAVILDAPSERARLTADVVKALTDAGYEVTRGSDGVLANYLRVTK